jgi:hypothetical protein
MPAPRTDLRPAPRRFRVRTLMVTVALVALSLAGGKWLVWHRVYWNKVQSGLPALG